MKQARTGVNPDFRALLQLSVRSPRKAVRLSGGADALLAFLPSEAYRTSCWARALPSCAYRPAESSSLRRGHSRALSEESARTTAWPHFRVSIQLALETTPKSPLSLPEVFHLVRPPPDLPPTISSKLGERRLKNSYKYETLLGFGCHWL